MLTSSSKKVGIIISARTSQPGIGPMWARHTISNILSASVGCEEIFAK